MPVTNLRFNITSDWDGGGLRSAARALSGVGRSVDRINRRMSSGLGGMGMLAKAALLLARQRRLRKVATHRGDESASPTELDSEEEVVPGVFHAIGTSLLDLREQDVHQGECLFARRQIDILQDRSEILKVLVVSHSGLGSVSRGCIRNSRSID